MKSRLRFLAQRRAAPKERSHEQRGATMAEFAVAFPFAVLLVLGVIQLGLMYTAKEIVNEAAFMAARAGSVQNAKVDAMTSEMVKALTPFYQDLTQTDDLTRLGMAYGRAKIDTFCIPLAHCFLRVERLNPTDAAFDDFGVTSNAMQNQTFIPNDNLEYRPHSTQGPKSGMSIQDANALKIKVTYGYELKVPLMQRVISAVMCGNFATVRERAFTDWNSIIGLGSVDDCLNFYLHGRVPIVSYATVQMQTPALKN